MNHTKVLPCRSCCILFTQPQVLLNFKGGLYSQKLMNFQKNSAKFLRVSTKLTQNQLKYKSGRFPNSLEIYRTVWKVSLQLESFQRVWKVSRGCGKFPDNLERFQIVWNFSRQSGRFLINQSGKFLDSLENFWTAWKVSGQSGSLQPICKCQRFVITWTKSLQFATNKVHMQFLASQDAIEVI